jgi:beta-lactamase regulating signal transducer with metallopeptidase domain
VGNSFIDVLGWTLVHFLWQGAIVAVVLWVALRAFAGKPAQMRYGACAAALAVLALCPVVTVCVLHLPTQPAPEQTVSVVRSVEPVAGVVAVPTETLSSVVAARPALRSWIPPLVMAWAIGVLLLSMRLLGAIIAVERLRRRFCLPAPADWQNRLDALARGLAIGRRVVLAVSHRVEVPSTVGVFRAVVILPASILTKLSPDQVEAILVHELAHVARHDYLVNLLQSLLETVLFYHPAVWWVSHVARIEREHCCDDAVLRLGGHAARYAETLALLEEQRLAPALSVRATGGSLLNRIRRILGSPSAPARPSAAGAIAFLLPGFVVVSMLSAFIVLVGVYRLMQYARWTTDSPHEQAGLRLVALQMDVPSGFDVDNTWTQCPPGWTAQRAWFEVVDRTRWNYRAKNPLPKFLLVGKAGFPMWLHSSSNTLGKPWQNGRALMVVDIPPGYGPEYVGGELEAFAGHEVVGRWRLRNMTPPTKAIADEEPLRTEAEALGYRVTITSPAVLRPLRSDADTYVVGGLIASADMSPLKPGYVEKDKIEADMGCTRTTWGVGNHFPSCVTGPIDPRYAEVAGDCLYRGSARRAEFRLTLRRYRTLDEVVVFRNIRAYVMSPPGRGQLGTYMADVRQPQSVTTPSGLTITLPVSSQIALGQPGCVGIRVRCAQGYEAVTLLRSPLCSSTGKPVDISIQNQVSLRNNLGTGVELSARVPNEMRDWSVAYRADDPRPDKPWVIPELRLIVQQKAVLEERTVKFLVPVTVGDWQPKKGASGAHER